MMVSTLLLSLVPLGAHAGETSDLPAGAFLPEVALEDVNPRSPFSGRQVKLADNAGLVSLWYFLGEDDHMLGQIDPLDSLDVELDDDAMAILLYVVVPASMSSQLGLLARGHDLPVLLDAGDRVRSAWHAKPGDLYLLDTDIRLQDRMRLGEDDLRLPSHLDDLESRVENFVLGLTDLSAELTSLR